MIKRLNPIIPFHPYPVGPPGVILKYRCFNGKEFVDCDEHGVPLTTKTATNKNLEQKGWR